MPQAATPVTPVTAEPLKLGRQWRTFELNYREIDEEARTAPLSFSSEEPYERWWGVEVLGHSPTEVDMSWIASGRAPVLASHDTRSQIGVVLSAELGTDRKGRAVVKFGKSARAEEEFQDVRDGVRVNVSVGYEILELELVKQEGETSTYRVTKWKPLEISLVSIPADMTVGVGRSDDEKDPRAIPIRGALPSPTPQPITLPAKPKERKMELTEEERAKLQKEAREQALSEEKARSTGIIALATKHMLREMGDKAVNDGTSLELFRGMVLDELYKKGSNVPLQNPANEIGLTERQSQQFSVTRFMRSLIEKDANVAPFETECAKAVRESLEKNGYRGHGKGHYLPYEVMRQPLPGVRAENGHLMIGDRVIAAQRDLASSSLASGGAMVATDLYAADFITLLRAASLVRRMGARVLSGLVGNVSIPRQIGTVTPGWAAQGGPGAESDSAYAQVTLSPKTAHAIQDVTRDLLIQGTPAVEGLIRADMIEAMATQLDYIAIHGLGTGNQPTGLLNTAGIGAVIGGTNGAAPTWDHIVELESQVANANAAMGSVGYLTNSKVRGKLKRTQKFTGTNGQEIWLPSLQGDDAALFGQLNGYRAGVSNNVRSDLTKGTSAGTCSAITYGNWADLLIGEWGVAEILPDEVTQAVNRIIRMHIWQTIDVGVRRAQSFSAMLDATTA